MILGEPWAGLADDRDGRRDDASGDAAQAEAIRRSPSSAG